MAFDPDDPSDRLGVAKQVQKVLQKMGYRVACNSTLGKIAVRSIDQNKSAVWIDTDDWADIDGMAERLKLVWIEHLIVGDA